MAVQRCECCHEQIAPYAKYCNWCGYGPRKRKPKAGEYYCKQCHEMVGKEFSYCPWCGEDFKDDYAWEPDDGELTPAVKRFNFDIKCPQCKYGCCATMDYCPWCGTKLSDYKFIGFSNCVVCGNSGLGNWQHCVFCGAFLQQVVRLSEKKRVSLSKEALFFLTSATVERLKEVRPGKWFWNSDLKGFETLGFLFGEKTATAYKVTHIFPMASAESKQDSVGWNPDALKGLVNHMQLELPRGLNLIGDFHSHPDDKNPSPSIVDYKGTLGDMVSIIVALHKTTKKSFRWKFNKKIGMLEGVKGGVYFRICAYHRNKKGVAELLNIVGA
ncbi:hypothetical protein FP828_08015 [bacterium]|nr:hypothetical protein [bacterium]